MCDGITDDLNFKCFAFLLFLNAFLNKHLESENTRTHYSSARLWKSQ